METTITPNYWSARFIAKRVTDNSIVTIADVVIASDLIPDLTHTAERLGLMEDFRIGVIHEGPVPIDVVDESFFIEKPAVAYNNMKVWRLRILEDGDGVPTE